MYEPPIQLIYRSVDDIPKIIAKSVDDCIWQAVVAEHEIYVDKDELIKALQYDRDQYEKGYQDAMVSIVRCKDCKYTDIVTCPITGAETLFCEFDIKPVATEPNGFCHRGERKNEKITCKDCKHLVFSDCYGECSAGHKGVVQPWDYCKHAEPKDGRVRVNEQIRRLAVESRRP